MSGGMALWGGFSSFFSIWQICILQISPFFIAFIFGIYLTSCNQKTDHGIFQWVILPCIFYGIGFTVFYSLLTASGLTISRPLISNIGSLRIVAGIFFLLVGLYLILVNRIILLGKLHHPLPLSVLFLLIGASLSIVYSPCITPMLSDIMGLATQRSTAVEGWYLASWYGLGISIALCITSVTLIVLVGKREIILRNINIVINACGIILLTLAFMNMTGLMRHYKAFVLGFLV